jgi:hypothetical protein
VERLLPGWGSLPGCGAAFRLREHCAAGPDRSAAATRAESEKARRRSCDEALRATLRRAVSAAAAGASSEAEFFARLEHAAVLVRRRFSSRDAGQVTGFAIAMPGDLNRAGGAVWSGGGKSWLPT